jgi:midasin (ATPase involved in ribosome maturation)
VQALERIAGLLEDVAGGSGSLVIAERGDAEGVPRHPNFRLFGAMNPATDAGECASIDAVGEVQQGQANRQGALRESS